MSRKKSDKPKLSWRMQQFIKNPKASWTRTRHICEKEKLSEEFIEKYADVLDWYLLCQYQDLSEDFCEKHRNQVRWSTILSRNLVSENFLRKYADDLKWSLISSSSMTLSKDFVREFKHKIDWGRFFYSRAVTQDWLEEFVDGMKNANLICWGNILRQVSLTCDFIRANMFRLNKLYNFWDAVSTNQKLDEDFILEFGDNLNWRALSEYQVITDKIMEKYKNKIYWGLFFKSNKNVDNKVFETYNEYFDWACWSNIIRYQNVTEEFCEKWKNKIPWEHIDMLTKCGFEFSNCITPEFVKKYLK